MVWQQDRDPDSDADLAIGASVEFDLPVVMDVVDGGSVQLGSAIVVQISVEGAAELRIFYSVTGPAGTFRDRGTVDQLTANAALVLRLQPVGTNVRLRVTNTSGATNAVAFTAQVV